MYERGIMGILFLVQNGLLRGILAAAEYATDMMVSRGACGTPVLMVASGQ